MYEWLVRGTLLIHHHKVFDAAEICGLKLASRIVMSPMTRSHSPGGIPGPDVAAYYRRRAEAGVGLIVTEGTWIPHPGASNDDNVPRFYGEDALAGWARVVRAVHEAGGKIVPQLWHAGLVENPQAAVAGQAPLIGPDQIGPSGLAGGAGKPPIRLAEPMTDKQIDAVIEAYGRAAESAMALGFDGIELHGAHGYLIDQFFWQATNLRTDRYGGGIAERSRFAAEVIRECRRRTRPDFPLLLRISQWKQQDFGAKLVSTPDRLMDMLAPLVDAGVDMFHCSTRVCTVPEFEGSDLNLAGWVKKLTGKPTMTVGSIGMSPELKAASLDGVLARFDRGDFDLLVVGRPLLADPEWAVKMRSGRMDEIRPFDRSLLATLY